MAWTPAGYYDASAGADELLGWHINRGPDQAADFFPATLFGSQYNRPDLIARALSPDAAAAPPPILLPPVVRILSPENNAGLDHSPAKLRIALRSPGGDPIPELKLLRDGRPLRIEPLPADFRSGETTLEVEMPAQDTSLDGHLNDTLKAAIDLDKDLAKWFIGLASGVVTGARAYFKAGPAAGEPARSRFFYASLGSALSFAVLSIFFGHLWLVSLRNQVAADYLALTDPTLLWPERLQYLCFIVSASSFVLLILERRTSTTQRSAGGA